ncbi:uncharacterized protein LOC141674688 [Apium graveolens]|uniref:uncharacterized protein LOC141674688 n=1 Tax=Apium graveolens TaxID=4045 RepID=UPI003D7B40F5
MSLLSWNCRGLAKPHTVRFLKEIVRQLRPGLIFLSETLVHKNKVEEVCKKIDYVGYRSVDVNGDSGGLALFWKNEGSVQTMGSDHHYIDFEVENNQIGRWHYTGFYGCPERHRRRESWEVLRGLSNTSMLPWCNLGDFNDLISIDEKSGGNQHSRSLIEGFVQTVDDCGLLDLGFEGEKFTWERCHGKYNWVQERLDRGLANRSWCELFPFAVVKVLEVSTSDHLPLFLQLNKQVFVPRVNHFKFENIWLKESEFINLVKMLGRVLLAKI